MSPLFKTSHFPVADRNLIPLGDREMAPPTTLKVGPSRRQRPSPTTAPPPPPRVKPLAPSPSRKVRPSAPPPPPWVRRPLSPSPDLSRIPPGGRGKPSCRPASPNRHAPSPAPKVLPATPAAAQGPPHARRRQRGTPAQSACAPQPPQGHRGRDMPGRGRERSDRERRTCRIYSKTRPVQLPDRRLIPLGKLDRALPPTPRVSPLAPRGFHPKVKDAGRATRERTNRCVTESPAPRTPRLTLLGGALACI